MEGKVAITGANGFIGLNVVHYFLTKGIHPTCCVRRNADLRYLEGKDLNFAFIDLDDVESLEDAFEDADCVIHIAGMARDWGSRKAFFRVNVTGTMNVLEAANQMKVKRTIITGSISSYGEENSQHVKNEESPYNSHYRYFLDRIFPSGMNHYRDSKARATWMAIDEAKKRGMNLIVMEPAWVFGPHEFHTGFYEYLKTVQNGIPFMPGSKENKFHVIYAEDLARAYYLACTSEIKGIERIIAGNRTAERMDLIYTLFCRELNKSKPKNLPKFLVYPAGFLSELIYTIVGAKKPPMLTRARVNMFYDNIEYSTEKARVILGFETKFPLAEAIRHTVEWYKREEFI